MNRQIYQHSIDWIAFWDPLQSISLVTSRQLNLKEERDRQGNKTWIRWSRPTQTLRNQPKSNARNSPKSIHQPSNPSFRSSRHWQQYKNRQQMGYKRLSLFNFQAPYRMIHSWDYFLYGEQLGLGFTLWLVHCWVVVDDEFLRNKLRVDVSRCLGDRRFRDRRIKNGSKGYNSS